MADEEEVALETVGEAGKSLADQADARILDTTHTSPWTPPNAAATLPRRSRYTAATL